LSDSTHIPGGYVLLARIMQDSAIWCDDPHVLKLFIYLIMEARFDVEPKKYPGFELKRGEVLTSLSQIADDNEYFRHTIKKWSRSKVSRMLEKLQEQGYIEQVSDTYGTHIKITKYETYQNPELYVANSFATVVKQFCNGSETEVDISKKGNKGKNDNNDKKNIFRKPTIPEIEDYCLERNNGIDPEKFYHYHESKGWKVGKAPMKNWKSAVITFEKNQKQFSGRQEKHPKSDMSYLDLLEG